MKTNQKTMVRKKKRNRAVLGDLLKKYHTGMEMAVSGKELELALGIRRDTIQKMVHQLRMEGVPICSSSSGYFYAQTRQELAETVARFNKHITTMVQTESRLLGTAPDEKEEIVFTLPDEGLKVSFNIKSMKKG